MKFTWKWLLDHLETDKILSEILEKLPEDDLKKFLIEKIGRQINGC